MAGTILAFAWAALIGLTLLWLLSRRPAPVPDGPGVDPHGGQVAEFRRQVHDWDRSGDVG